MTCPLGASGPVEEILSVRFHGARASTAAGPAAGPQSQLAQNVALSWLVGSRIIELKTVQVDDRLAIPRPCIDAANVGYNVEWSQELRLEQSLDEYVKAWMLVHALQKLNPAGLRPEEMETLFDFSVGYSLEGIRVRTASRGGWTVSATPARSFNASATRCPPIYARGSTWRLHPKISERVTCSRSTMPRGRDSAHRRAPLPAPPPARGGEDEPDAARPGGGPVAAARPAGLCRHPRPRVCLRRRPCTHRPYRGRASSHRNGPSPDTPARRQAGRPRPWRRFPRRRRDDLAPSDEVGLESVVVGRIVACGDTTPAWALGAHGELSCGVGRGPSKMTPRRQAAQIDAASSQNGRE